MTTPHLITGPLSRQSVPPLASDTPIHIGSRPLTLATNTLPRVPDGTVVTLALTPDGRHSGHLGASHPIDSQTSPGVPNGVEGLPPAHGIGIPSNDGYVA